jgi:hypothetical protein
MLDPIFKSAGQDVYGPIQIQTRLGSSSATGGWTLGTVQKFQDTYSVLGWGRMPDTWTGLGSAQLTIHHHLSTILASSEAWKDFFRSADALTFRKAAASIPQQNESLNLSAKMESVGSMLNDLTDRFPIHQTYMGSISESEFKKLNPRSPVPSEVLQSLASTQSSTANGAGSVYGVFESAVEEKVPTSTVLGRAVWDHSVWKKTRGPRLLPFEIVNHFEVSEVAFQNLKTSLKSDSLVIPKTASASAVQVGSQWDYPLQEIVLAQDPYQTRIGFSEMMWMTDFSPLQIQQILLLSGWMGTHLKSILKKSGFQLQSASLRLGLDTDGTFFLGSKLTLDELRVVNHQVAFHTDLSLAHYQKTSWHDAVVHAKKTAKSQGLVDWKRLCIEAAPWIEPKIKANLERLIPTACQMITGISVGNPFTSLAELKTCFSELKLV